MQTYKTKANNVTVTLRVSPHYANRWEVLTSGITYYDASSSMFSTYNAAAAHYNKLIGL